MKNLPEHEVIPNENILDPETEVSFHDEQEYTAKEFPSGFQEILDSIEESQNHPEERKPRPSRLSES